MMLLDMYKKCNIPIFRGRSFVIAGGPYLLYLVLVLYHVVYQVFLHFVIYHELFHTLALFSEFNQLHMWKKREEDYQYSSAGCLFWWDNKKRILVVNLICFSLAHYSMSFYFCCYHVILTLLKLEHDLCSNNTLLLMQLRNLVWATSKHDVYLMSHFSVIHWSSLNCSKREVLNVSGHVAPCEKHPGSLLEGFTQTQVSTLAVKDKLLVAGGFHGELICKYLERPGVSYCTRTTHDENAITNAVEIYTSNSGAVHFIASNNDGGVRDFDMEKFQQCSHSHFPWPVNHTSLSPDGKLLVIVGDDPEGILVDSRCFKQIASLHGHLDYSFASAWHPDSLTFTTGNQDKTCRIWDVRNLSKSVTALKGNLGAIRSLRYTSDGKFMAMAEPADFVHVFDVDSGYQKEQEIDFFGEISGMSFSPDTESLFIGVWDRTYGSLLEYGRRRQFSYQDAIM